MTVEEAIEFCKELETVHKEDCDDVKKLSEIRNMLREYNYMKDDFGKYEYICDRMSSDEYYELESMYEAECGEEEEEGEEED